MLHGMKQDWVLALPDKRLAERLCEYWRHGIYAECVQLRVFTQLDTLIHYHRLAPEVHLFVAAAEWRERLGESEESWFTGAKHLWLTTDHAKDSDQLYLYQPLPMLFEHLWKAGLLKEGRDTAYGKADRGRRAKIITVCSSGGGSGKTMVSFQLARYAAANGLRVFYWHIGLSPEWTLLYPDGTDVPRAPNSFSQLLYYLRRQGSSRREMPVDSFTLQVSALRADSFDAQIRADEWLEFTGRELSAVLDWLDSTNRYDLILIDAADSCNQLDSAIRLSDDIVWIVLDDLPHLNKTLHSWSSFKQHDREMYAALCARMHLVVNRYMGSMQNNWWSPAFAISGYFPYIPYWKQFHRAEQWFGSAVFQTAFEEWAVIQFPWLGSLRPQERVV